MSKVHETTDEFVKYSGSDLPLADPPPERLPPGMQYHERVGLFPIGCNARTEIALRRERLREEKLARETQDRLDAEERDRLAALPPPPPTLEERVAALEGRVAELEAMLGTPKRPRRKAA